MSASRYLDRIAIACMVFALVIALLLPYAGALGITAAGPGAGYEELLFDRSYVHTIDISMPGWDSWVQHAASEEYTAATVTIDGETYPNVGFRAKGNGSLFAVTMMNSPRFSWKIEFDRYNDRQTYHGLDKLNLNNLVEDTTYMKDHLVYSAMAEMGVPAPLSSYVFLTVNGEDFGLYQAVEGVEDGFLTRNFGSARGCLYKPDNAAITEFGMGADLNVWGLVGWVLDHVDPAALKESLAQMDTSAFEGMRPEDMASGFGAEAFDLTAMYGDGSSFMSGDSAEAFGGFSLSGLLGGAEDVQLKYLGDDPASYPNIFGSAKTRVSYRDKMRLIAALRRLGAREDMEHTVDADEVIRFFAVHNLFVNSDSYTGMSTHNYYLYEDSGVLRMIPWDYNLGYGTMLMLPQYAVNDPIDEPMAVTSDGEHPMFEWIPADADSLAAYHACLAELTDTLDFCAIIDETAALIRPYVERDPTKFVSMEEFDGGAAMLKTYLQRRLQSVRGQLSGEIPATKAGQKERPELLVSVDGIDLHALGDVTMGIADGRQDLSGLLGGLDFSALEKLFGRKP